MTKTNSIRPRSCDGASVSRDDAAPRICAFTTCNDAYVAQSLISLLSVRKWNPQIDLAVISRGLAEDSVRLLEAHGVDPVIINLDKQFWKSFGYPIECYYMFAGPEVLAARGYDYSVYIDGDVYCNNPIDIDWAAVPYYAGTSFARIQDLLGNDWETITRLWAPRTVPDYRINSGVVFFNNARLCNITFLSRIAELYGASIVHNIPRPGDDSLFSLFQLVYQSFPATPLGRRYNLVFVGDDVRDERDTFLRHWDDAIGNCVLFHLAIVTAKPWCRAHTFPCYTAKWFYAKWQQLAIDVLGCDGVARWFPGIDVSSARRNAKVFWWPGTNVGDLVTPYYLRRVCGIDDVDVMAATEQEIVARRTARDDDQLAHTFVTRSHAHTHDEVDQQGGPGSTAFMLGAGSIMRLCGHDVIVYGSGIRNRYQKVLPGSIRCVRGPLTRRRLLELGFECPPIYGDPGLLLSRFYKPKPVAPVVPLGIIPHQVEYSEVAAMYSDDLRAQVIDMGCGDVEQVIDQLVSCERVVSSSLHGIVFANSYGVPVRWIRFSNRITGDDTKFRDHFGAIGRPDEPYIDAIGFRRLDVQELFDAIAAYEPEIDLDRLQDEMFFTPDGTLKPSATYELRGYPVPPPWSVRRWLRKQVGRLVRCATQPKTALRRVIAITSRRT